MTSIPATLLPPDRGPRSLYPEVLSRVRAAGLMNRRPGSYAAYAAVDTAGLAAVLTALIVWKDSVWSAALAVVLAVVSVQFGFLGHDIAHRQVSRRARTCTALGLVTANLLSGLSYGWWMDKHNAHHAHPNDLDTDPDVQAGVIVFDVTQMRTRRGWAAVMTKYQAWLFLPLLVFEAVNLYIAGICTLARPGIRHRALELLLIGLHSAAYAVLLVTTMTWGQAAIFIALHQGVRGLYLGLSFAPNHKGMPVLSATQDADPFLRQVLTSRNIRGGPVTDWVLGGLNYQVEHHLFPSMPRANLPRAQEIVRTTCRLHAVPYIEVSATASYTDVLRHLYAVGAPLRQAPA